MKWPSLRGARNRLSEARPSFLRSPGGIEMVDLLLFNIGELESAIPSQRPLTQNRIERPDAGDDDGDQPHPASIQYS
jgi:hypothetical protein